MKKLNETYFTAAVYAFGVTAFAILFLVLCLNFGVITSAIGSFLSAVSSILYAILFAFLLFPAVKRFDGFFERLFSKKRPHPYLVSGFSISCALLLALGLIALLLVFIIPRLAEDAGELYRFVMSTKEKLDSFVAENAQDHPFLLEVYDAVASFLFDASESGSGSSLLQSLLAPASKLLSLIVSQVSSIAMGLIIAVYFLATRRVIGGIIGKLVVAVIPEKHVNRFVLFFKRIYTDFASFTFNRFLIAFLFAMVAGGVCWLIRVPLLSVIVILMLLAHMIPVIGPIIGDTLSVLFVTILKGTWWGLFFGAFMILLEIFSTNVLLVNALPKKLRPSYGVTAVVVLISLTLFGFIGAFLSVPLYASLNVEIRRFIIRRLSKRGLPTAADAYRTFTSGDYEAAVSAKSVSTSDAEESSASSSQNGEK